MRNWLAIDVGNTYIKGALVGLDHIGSVSRYATTSVEEAARNLLADGAAEPIALASVVPAATECIKSLALAKQREIFEVKPHTQKLLSNMHPEMGADRIASAAAAWKIYGKGQPTVVMTFGTATTLLAISAEGKIVGGYIAPGLTMMLDVLYERCALLPQLSITNVSTELGQDTQTHITNGVLLGHIGMIRAWLDEAKRTLGGTAVTVATGGWNQELQNRLHLFNHVDDDLILKGIYVIAENSP